MHSLNGGTLHLFSLLLPLLRNKIKCCAARTIWNVSLWADTVYLHQVSSDRLYNYCYGALRSCDEWNSQHFIHCCSPNHRFCQQPFVSWCISLPLSIIPNQYRLLAFPRRLRASESIKHPATDLNCTQPLSSLLLLRHKVWFRRRAPCNHQYINTQKLWFLKSRLRKKGFFDKGPKNSALQCFNYSNFLDIFSFSPRWSYELRFNTNFHCRYLIR